MSPSQMDNLRMTDKGHKIFGTAKAWEVFFVIILPKFFKILVDGNIHEKQRRQRQQPMDQKIQEHDVNMSVENILPLWRF